MSTRLSIYGLSLASLLALAGALPQRAEAAPVLSSSTYLCRGGVVGGVSDCRSNAGTTQASDHWVSSTPDYDAEAQAWAAYGVLKARTTATLSNYAPRSFPMNNLYQTLVVAAALSSFSDTLTISGGVGQGYFQPTFLVDGFASTTAPLFYNACVELGTGGVHPSVYNDCVRNTGAVHGYITPNPIAFTYGTAFDANVNFISVIGNSDDQWAAPYTASAVADFSHTVTLQDLLILDSNMQPIQGATLLAESGTQYALNPRNDGNTVPAPGSALLLALGFTSLAAVRRRV